MGDEENRTNGGTGDGTALLNQAEHLMENSYAGSDEDCGVFAHSRRYGMSLTVQKLSKLSHADDVEANLTTFERLMQAYYIDHPQWTVMLVPQLTVNAQTVHGEELFWRLRGSNPRHQWGDIIISDFVEWEGKSYQELVVRVSDLSLKWMKDYSGGQEGSGADCIEHVKFTMGTGKKARYSSKSGRWLHSGQEGAGSFLVIRVREWSLLKGHVARECKTDAPIQGKPASGGSGLSNTKPVKERGPLLCQKIGHIVSQLESNNSTWRISVGVWRRYVHQATCFATFMS